MVLPLLVSADHERVAEVGPATTATGAAGVAGMVAIRVGALVPGGPVPTALVAVTENV
jgi:hypothetical protein